MLKRLRELREDNDLKQKDIAELLEITTQQYQLYESGRREIPVRLLVKLAVFYSMSLDYITEINDIQKAPSGKLHIISRTKE